MPEDRKYDYGYDGDGGPDNGNDGDLSEWIPVLIFLVCFPPVGVVLLVATSVVTNRFILLPMYAKFAGMEGIIAMADNPSITSLTTLFIYGVIPFNVVKGLALSLVTFILYKPLSPLLHDR